METPPAIVASNDQFAANHYLLKRKLLKLIGSTFEIYDAAGTQIFQANQKGFKLKEDIRLMGGPGFNTELVGIFARQIMDFSAAYDVIDLQTNQKIGAYKRKGWNSIIRDEWIVMDAMDREVGTMIEDSMALALVRRFLSNLVPQNYDLLIGGERYVDLKQNFNPFTYHLNIDFFATPDRMDRRMGLAGAVLLAAIEGRQAG